MTPSEADARLFRWLYDSLSHGSWLWPMAALTVVGSGWSMLGMVPLLASAKTRRFGATLLTVLVATSLAVLVLKRAFGRARPCAALGGVRAMIFDAPSDFGFPSGHAAGSFAFAAFVAAVLVADAARKRGMERMYRLLGGGGVLALAAAIALSRVALGVHFPGDIAAGALLGTLIGMIGAREYLNSARAEEAERG